MTSSRQGHALRNIIAGILVLAGLVCLGGWWMIWRPLPTLDGTIAVPGITQTVSVDRDGWGVPWIRAASLEDLMFAQGYVVAQDRLWQMDLLRRAASGELSEIFGPVALDNDRENRILGLRVAAEAAAERMDPQSRTILEAYARGVNRYMDERHGRLPIEFTVLRYRPRHWTPADTFLISAYMWKTLTTTWKAKLNRARLTTMLGPGRARDVFTVDSPLDHFIVGAPITVGSPGGDASGASKYLGIPGAPATLNASPIAPASGGVSAATDALNASAPGPVPARISGGESHAAWNEAREFLSMFDSQTSEIIGSNNFVVNGEHTASGKPILANDTHLSFSMPGIWYIVHLTAPGWNVAGFTFPGSPLVVIGHNDRIAWGFTNSNADVEDLYAEDMNPSNPMEYRVGNTWTAVQVRREVIHVKGEQDVNVDVGITRHGPIVDREASTSGGHAYALRWTATEAGGLDFSYPLLGGAKNWDEFREVMRKIAGPGQNGIYADVDGNIGYIMAARIPIRKTGDGTVPVDGSTDDGEWTGYIPFDELPQVLNPPGGIIATANARTVGPAYKYFISDRWAAPYRTERIYQLLASRKDMHSLDANNVQNDTVSLPDQFMAQQLRAANAKTPARDPRTRTLIDLLPGWDGRASSVSVETSFLEYTRHFLMGALLRPYIGDRLNEYELWEPAGEYDELWWRDKIFLENVLRTRPPGWLPRGYANYDELLMTAADDATQFLRLSAPDGDPVKVNWGHVHLLEMFHPFGRSGILRRLLSIGPIEQGGTLDTVRAMGYRHGPAMRFVADLSDFDQSLMEIPAGESGQYASEHYRDQFESWFAGRGIPAPFTAAAEERMRAHRLILSPTNSAGSGSASAPAP